MKYIVTADDYGVSPIIDNAIDNAVQKGCVTAVAGFANATDSNGQFTVERLKQLKAAHPHIKVGLHFTLTSGMAVSGNPASLTRKSSRYFNPARYQDPKYSDENEVREELRAQIRVFTDAGLPIEHFSDHMGILTIDLKIAQVYFEVTREYDPKIPVRNPALTAAFHKIPDCLKKSKMHTLGRIGAIAGFLKFMNEKFMVKRLDEHQKAEKRTTDYFLEHLYRNPNKKTLTCIAKNAPKLPVNKRIHHRVGTSPIAEIVTHLATRPPDPKNDAEYQSAIKALKDHGGVSIGFVRNKRYSEYRLMIDHLLTIIPSSDLVSF